MQDMARLVLRAPELGYTVTGGELYRTPEQALLNAKAGVGIVHSLHIYRLAIDLDCFKDGAYITDGSQLKDLGEFWKSLGPDHYWGGDFSRPDGNHFSLSPDGGHTR